MMDKDEENQNSQEQFQGTQELQFHEEDCKILDEENNKSELSQRNLSDDENLPSPKRFCPMPEEGMPDVPASLPLSTAPDKNEVAANETPSKAPVTKSIEDVKGPEDAEKILNKGEGEANLTNSEGSEHCESNVACSQEDWCLQLTETTQSLLSTEAEDGKNNSDVAVEMKDGAEDVVETATKLAKDVKGQIEAEKTTGNASEAPESSEEPKAAETTKGGSEEVLTTKTTEEDGSEESLPTKTTKENDSEEATKISEENDVEEAVVAKTSEESNSAEALPTKTTEDGAEEQPPAKSAESSVENQSDFAKNSDMDISDQQTDVQMEEVQNVEEIITTETEQVKEVVTTDTSECHQSSNEKRDENSKDCKTAMVGSFLSPPDPEKDPETEESTKQVQFCIEKPPVLDSVMPVLGDTQETPDAEAFSRARQIAVSDKVSNEAGALEAREPELPSSCDESGNVAENAANKDDAMSSEMLAVATESESKLSEKAEDDEMRAVEGQMSQSESQAAMVKRIAGRKRPVLEDSELDCAVQENRGSTSPTLHLEKSPDKASEQTGKCDSPTTVVFDIPRKKLCIDKGTCISSPGMESRGVQVSLVPFDEHLIHANSSEDSPSGKSKKGMAQIITYVRRIITKKVIRDGKLVRTLVMEEEDDPTVQEVAWDSLASPPSSGSSRTTISSLPGSLLSGDLADVSSFTSKSTSSISSGSKSAPHSTSPPLANFAHANSPPSHYSPETEQHSPFLPRSWSSSVNLMSQVTPKRRAKASQRTDAVENSSSKMPPNEASDDDSFKLPNKVARKAAATTPKSVGRKKKGVKFDRQIQSAGKNKSANATNKQDLPAVDNDNCDEEPPVLTSEVIPNLHTNRSANQSQPQLTKIVDKVTYESDAGAFAAESVGSESGGKSVLPGMRVMARWVDGCYYSGLVQSQTEDGRWMVVYDDDQTRAMSEEDIILVPILDSGQSVLVPSASGFYDTGVITCRFRQGAEIGYVVENEDGIAKRFTRSEVVLSSEQAESLLGGVRNRKSSAEVSLENIVEGKRRRSTGFSPLGRPASDVRKQKGKKKPDPNVDSTSTDTSGEGTKQDAVRETSKDETFGVTEKATRYGEKNAHKISKAINLLSLEEKTRSPKRKADNASSAQQVCMGPLLPSGSTLFKDFSCLLSYAEKKSEGNLRDGEFSSMDSEADSGSNPTLPFDKVHLKAQIESGGGTVLEKFEQTQTTQSKHVLLIAATHLRTIKYIQCLAAGIPCVSHHWVKDCISVNRINSFTSYLLPAGYSIVSRSLIEWHSKNTVLKGMHVLLVSASNDQFVDTWTPVLLAAKADIVRRLPVQGSAASSYNVDIIVSDPSCPTQVLRRATVMGIPIVSSEWIIQCLITGQRLKPDAHPKFRHSYSE